MSEWKTYKLGEIAKRITSGGTPSTRRTEFYGGNIPWLRTQEVNFNRIYDTEIKITNEAVKNSSAKMIEENSIIVAMYGATAGRIAINKIPLTTNQACCNISLDDKKADYNFVYYTLKSKFGEIFNMATGAAQQNLNAGMLRDFEILAPDLPTQRQIAQILTSLDDKIELNLQMNQTLEAMAQAIFKEWFVNFNFPGFDGELVDGLPKGWQSCLVKDFGKIICGKTPSKAVKEYFGGEYMFIKIPDMHNSVFIIETSDSLTEEGLNSQTNKTIPPFSICVSSIATVGLVCINPEPCQTNQQINSIVPKNNHLKYFLYFLTTSMKETFLATASGGTATLNMNTSQFSNISAFMPSDVILKAFDEIVSPIMEKILDNEYNIKSLTQTRDTLLPKLMSGSLNLDSFDLSDESDSEGKSTKSFNHKNQSADK